MLASASADIVWASTRTARSKLNKCLSSTNQ